MNVTVIKKLPPIDEIIQSYPLSKSNYQKIQEDRKEVQAILNGNDNRLLMIVGPCSAWPKAAVLDYAERLLNLNDKVKHALKLIMRVYIQKPRTTKGWMGPVNQPNPCASPDILAGIKYTREMMIQIIQMGLPIADEALFTHNAKGFLELLSWVAIGARSTENQEHRVFASAIDCPVGLKNPTHGSLAVSVNSIVAAQYSHAAIFDGYEVQTHGNPYAHLVLRGSNHMPNYSISHLDEVKKQIEQHQIKNPAIIIDASHDNCLLNGKKDHRLQPQIISTILENLKNRPDLKKLVKGFMVESFLKEGHQKLDENDSVDFDLGGLSITDPCLSWEQTEDMLLHLGSQFPF
jgi:3-deoxy-7-phosphoheptulonate synthase